MYRHEFAYGEDDAGGRGVHLRMQKLSEKNGPALDALDLDLGSGIVLMPPPTPSSELSSSFNSGAATDIGGYDSYFPRDFTENLTGTDSRATSAPERSGKFASRKKRGAKKRKNKIKARRRKKLSRAVIFYRSASDEVKARRRQKPTTTEEDLVFPEIQNCGQRINSSSQKRRKVKWDMSSNPYASLDTVSSSSSLLSGPLLPPRQTIRRLCLNEKPEVMLRI